METIKMFDGVRVFFTRSGVNCDFPDMTVFDKFPQTPERKSEIIRNLLCFGKVQIDDRFTWELY